jgi:hypothetical protein
MTIDVSDGGRPSFRRDRYVKTGPIKAAAKGRESDIVRSVGVSWPPPHGRDHITCPYADQDDHNPSWRLMGNGAAICTCSEGRAHSIFDVVIKVLGVDFEEAKIRVAEILGRQACSRDCGND